MEYQIINATDESFLISDSFTVERYDSAGTRQLEGVPGIKTFREMAYISPPVFVDADSFIEAKSQFFQIRH